MPGAGLCSKCIYIQKNSFIFYLFLLLLIMVVPKSSASTFLGESYPIHIVPEGDVTLKYGDSLELFCLLNKSHELGANLSSVNMRFSWNKNENFTGETTIINDTAIRLFVPEPDLGEVLFHCELDSGNGHRPLMLPVSVAVGNLPEPVTNFTCYSPNWDNLTCHWTPPHNHIRTTYRGFLNLQGRAARHPKPCPKNLDVINNTCTFSKDQYHRAHKIFYFNITGTNKLGSKSQNFTIMNFDTVIPSKPFNLTIVNKTRNSCLIEWSIPHPLQHLPIGLSVIIEVKSEWDSWLTLNTSHINIKAENYTYNIENLKYAGTPYDVRVYLKSPTSPYKSDAATLTFVTLPAKPSSPPMTSPGCFDMTYKNNSYVLYVYWRMIEDYLKNGGKFDYKIDCLRNGRENCTRDLVEKSMSYAIFFMFGDHNYRFRVYSVNEVGLSENFSEVFVPKFETVSRPYRPVKMTYGEGEYGLAWSHVGRVRPENYTVFYCEDDRERPLPCKGLLSWEIVPGNVTAKNVTVTNKGKFYHFGVSAQNANGDASGISWATCVVSPNSVDLTVTELAIHAITSQTAQVVWQLGCAETSALAGFILYYCSVRFSENNTICEGEEQTLKVIQPQLRNTTITNLKPYTTYDVKVSILNEGGVPGRRSSAKRFTTFEDAPDPPTNLRATNVTNSSVALTWDLPLHKNGAIQKFLLYINPGPREPLSIEVQDKDNIDEAFEVTGLNSSTRFTFALEACTGKTKCSLKSEPLTLTTRMHEPSIMRSPRVSILNQTAANVTWEPPTLLSNSYVYQIEVRSIHKETLQIFNYTGDSAIVPIDEFCDVHKNEIQFLARAINIDNEFNISFEGPWSRPETARCDSSIHADFYVVVMIIVVLSLAIVIGGCVSFLVKRGYIKCKEMKDVVVKLPSGLEPPQDLEKSPREIWPPPHRNGDSPVKPTCNASDEETLLSKKIGDEGDTMKCPSYAGSSSDSDCVALECPTDPHLMPWEGPVRGGHHNHLNDPSDPLPELDYEDDESESSAVSVVDGYSRVGRLVDSPPNVHDGYVTIAENGSVVPTSSSSTPSTSVTPSTSSGSDRTRSDRSGSSSYVILPTLALGVKNNKTMNGSAGSKNNKNNLGNNIGPSKTAYILSNFSETNGSIVQAPKYIESSFSMDPNMEDNYNNPRTKREPLALNSTEEEYELDDDDLAEISVSHSTPSTSNGTSYVPHHVYGSNFV